MRGWVCFSLLALMGCHHDHGFDTDTHAVLPRGVNARMAHAWVGIDGCDRAKYRDEDGHEREGLVVFLDPVDGKLHSLPRIVVGEGSRFEVGDYAWRVTEVWWCGAVAEQLAPVPRPPHEKIEIETSAENWLGDEPVLVFASTSGPFRDIEGRERDGQSISIAPTRHPDHSLTLGVGTRFDMGGAWWRVLEVHPQGALVQCTSR